MFNSNVLEVAIGLVFCYASVALMSSSVFEAIANWLNLRSRNLLKGISDLLNAEQDGVGKELLMAIYNHGVAHPLGSGAADSIKAIKNKPAYIAASDFASVMMGMWKDKSASAQAASATLASTAPATSTAAATADNTQIAAGGDQSSSATDQATAAATQSKAAATMGDSQLAQVMNHFHAKFQDDAEKIQDEVAKWFDSSMEQVSAAYKRNSQLWCFAIALVITIVFNIDSVQLFKTLWLQPQLVAQLNVTGDLLTAKQALPTLQELPIGWQADSLCKLKETWFLGWLVTASASLFGAPFWFDLLKNLTRLRSTAKKDGASSSSKS